MFLGSGNGQGMALVTSEMGHSDPFGSPESFWAGVFLNPDAGKILRKLWDLAPCSWAAAVRLELEPTTSGAHLPGSHIYPNPRWEEWPTISHWGVVGEYGGSWKTTHVERIREMDVQPASLPEPQG